MLRRSRAREVALQVLFEHDLNKTPMSAAAVAKFVRDRMVNDAESVAFCSELLAGVSAHRAEIDAAITETAENWRLSRMLPSDRNVLRLAVYELLHHAQQVPVPVLLNEAIELARRFGTVDSPGFVNGLLDKLARRRAKATESPAAPPA